MGIRQGLEGGGMKVSPVLAKPEVGRDSVGVGIRHKTGFGRRRKQVVPHTLRYSWLLSWK